MASITKHKSGWRVFVERKDTRKTKVLPTKRLAEQWAAAEETKLLAEKAGGYPDKTLADAFDRYVKEVSVTKQGFKFERLRCEAFVRDFPKIAKKKLVDLDTPDWADWRDQRLKNGVTRGTVQRELKLYKNVFTIAQNEWKWLAESPLKGMRMPGENPPRDRLVQVGEIRKICRRLNYVSGQQPSQKVQEVAIAFLLGLRTGMRASELLQLGPNTVNFQTRVAAIEHKTQYLTGKPRLVPLQQQAIKLIKLLPNGFTVASASLDALFRKATKSLLIDDLHFHDSRGTALTRLSRKVDVMTLAKISGHKDLNILLSTYYRETASEIAQRI